ncbi:MAG: hypothetical protein E7639_05120 [Ruminococcaceae bacterium]|nr:hypothetical protein [Oscillospiraceae bacterium]
MKQTMTGTELLISDIRLPFDAPEGDVIRIAKTKMKRLCDAATGLHFRLYKKSIDARKKPAVMQVCSVLVTADEPLFFEQGRAAALGIRPFVKAVPQVVHGTEKLAAPPLVVGMGPAGLFAALMLAEWGYTPVLIDRGDDVITRAAKAERFRLQGVLDSESNIQFGAGGAGTFSDGKLVTRVNDALCNYVLERLVDFGAPREVLIKAKPHVGTDILRVVVNNILSRISELGGRVLYRTRLEGFCEQDGSVVARTTVGDIQTGALVLAIGHSARDTFEMLLSHGLSVEPKPFSVGLRVEHRREDIDRALYGSLAGHPMLGPAEYALSDTRGARGVYTFCMCPGGEVVAAASEEGGVVVNGMSYHARNGENSNAAVLVSVTPDDVGGTVQSAIDFQRALERAAFAAGGGDYVAPVETVGDFLNGYQGTAPSRVQPTYGGGRVRVSDISAILPPFVVSGLQAGLSSFDKKINGYAASHAVLTGTETRTSSPLRILRSEARSALAHDRIFPVGEGAGYAGGITSAALDGLKTALAIIGRWQPLKSF